MYKVNMIELSFIVVNNNIYMSTNYTLAQSRRSYDHSDKSRMRLSSLEVVEAYITLVSRAVVRPII